MYLTAPMSFAATERVDRTAHVKPNASTLASLCVPLTLKFKVSFGFASLSCTLICFLSMSRDQRRTQVGLGNGVFSSSISNGAQMVDSQPDEQPSSSTTTPMVALRRYPTS